MRIATVGDNCMDVYVNLGNRAFPGGNPVNVAVYLARLGEHPSYLGVVGDDEHGVRLREAVAAKGVDVSRVRTLPGKTAVSYIKLVEGQRVFGDYEEGVMADFRLDEEDRAFLRGFDLVHTGIWGMVERDLPELHRRGPLISFDFADKYDHEILGIALPHVDYAFFAAEEDTPFVRDLIRRAQARGPRVAVATLGANGSLAWDGKEFTPFGIVPVEVVDNMGAGDSYIAGFMRGVLLGEPLARCMALGAENASVTLTTLGAW